VENSVGRAKIKRNRNSLGEFKIFSKADSHKHPSKLWYEIAETGWNIILVQHSKIGVHLLTDSSVNLSHWN
jgi:hypothetical protein